MLNLYFESGMIWMIGNGASINVWKDRWIPRPTSFKVIANIKGCDSNLRVLDLINWSDGRWKHSLLDEILLSCDAELVKQIRLVGPGTQDDYYWYYTKNGVFSVKSASHLLMEEQETYEGGVGQSAASTQATMWKRLWKLQMIPKVKEFAWRAGREVLPCKANLLRRRITEDNLCSLCGKEETGFHVPFECWPAKQTWVKAGFKHFSNGARATS